MELLGEHGVIPPKGPLESDTKKCISTKYPEDIYKPWLERANERLQRINQARENGDFQNGIAQKQDSESSQRRPSPAPNDSYAQSKDSKMNSYAASSFEDSTMRYDDALDSQPSFRRFKESYTSIMEEHVVSAAQGCAAPSRAGRIRSSTFSKRFAVRLPTSKLHSKMLDGHFDSENRRVQTRA